MRRTSRLISCLLLLVYFSRTEALIISIISSNSSLSFAEQDITITLAFNEQISGSIIPFGNIELSSSPTFANLNCTFTLVLFALPGILSSTHTLTLSSFEGVRIRQAIGNNPDMDCLADRNSTYLRIVIIDSIQEIFVNDISQLNVIPDLTPPQVSSFQINFQLGRIRMFFSEPIIVSTLNISSFTIRGIFSELSTPLSIFTNSLEFINDDLDLLTFDIILEVFEISMLDSMCNSNCPCVLEFLSNVSIASDVFGNVLTNPTNTIQVSLVSQFTMSSFSISSPTVTPVSPNQANITFSAPSNLRPSDLVFYRIFVLPLFVDYYRGECDFIYGYRNQLATKRLRTSRSLSDLDCRNSTEYLCYVTQDTSLVVNIFEGFYNEFRIDTVYTNIQFNLSSNSFISAGDFYQDLLNIQFLRTQGLGPIPIPILGSGLNDSIIFPLGNRAVLKWKVPSPSFCEEHRVTIRYNTNPVVSIDLDADTVCGAEYVYVYLPNNGRCETRICLFVEVRITSPSDLLPNNTCVYASIPKEGTGLEFNNEIFDSIFIFDSVDIPVVESISITIDNRYSIRWSSFPSSPMDYFNVYIFPVYALKYDGGSCGSIDVQTPASDFSLYPAELYRYGVSIPRNDFNLTCPENSDPSIPYECYSTFSNTRQISVNISTQFAFGVIVEAVVFTSGTTPPLKVQSYPAIISTWSINLDNTQGQTYRQISWNQNLCLNLMSSVLFRVYEFNKIESRAVSLDFMNPLHGNYLIPCSTTPALITELPQSFEATGYLFNDLQIANEILCLSGFETPQIIGFNSNNGNPDVVLNFNYLNYFTISLSIAIDGAFDQPAFIFLIPSEVLSLSISSIQSDICPRVVNGQLSDSRVSFFQVNGSNSSNDFLCENSANDSCVFVENTFNLTFNVSPGFEHTIFVNSTSELLNFRPGNDIPRLGDTDLLNRQALLYTNSRFVPNNSIIVEWDTDFYCPPDSLMYVYWEVNSLDVDQTFLLYDEVSVPCQGGSYTIENTEYSAEYYFSSFVFFNSTEIIPSCPIIDVTFDTVKTAEFIQKIELIDFENVYVQWNSVPGISSYTLLAVPSSIFFFQDPIGSVYSTDSLPQCLEYNSVSNIPINVIFQMCLNSSVNLTCSKLTTSNIDAILTVLPGVVYKIAVAYEVQNNTIVQPDSIYDPEKIVREITATSGFNNVFLYNYSTEICTDDARAVFSYTRSIKLNTTIFRVVSCQDSPSELSIPDIPFITPEVIFLFPYQEIQYPGITHFTTTPASFAIVSSGVFSSLPAAAAPILTNVEVAASSGFYQASWTNSPSLPIAQQFESYTLYALPNSRNFTLGGGACPVLIYPGCFFASPIIPLRNRSITLDLCPYSRNFYFCQEFSTATQSQLALFPLLDYSFFVESRYDGGLRAYFIDESITVGAPQHLMDSLNLIYQVTSVSIEVQWDTSSVFCVDSTVAFLYSTQIDPSIPVPCPAGNFSLGPLKPNTEYEVFLYFDYNPTRMYPGPDECIRSNPVSAFQPFPVTSSFCLTQQPCGSLGLCSEGFSNNSYHCDCLTGYEFDGNTCAEINECNVTMNPCVNGLCSNTVGSFTCLCFEGFEIVSAQCVDVNECNVPDTCINGLCTNLPPPANYRCECDPLFGGRTCNISIETSTCPSFTESNEFGNDITFPATPRGEEAIVTCSQLDITLFGTISKRCNDELEWESTNFDNCLSATFLSLQVTRIAESESSTLTAEVSIAQSLQLASVTDTDNGVLYPGEISEAVASLEFITSSIESLTGEELRSTLAQVQDSVVAIASNIFRVENMGVILASPQIQTQSLASSVVLSVETLGTLLGSILPINTTLSIVSPNAALVVAVISRPDQPFVIGPNSVPNFISNESALVRAQASVSIPVSVIRDNDIGAGVEVSFSVYPNLAQLLGEVAAEVPLSERERSVNDTLGTGVSNLNIYTRGGGRVEVLSEDILLTFGLIYDPPVLENNVKFRIVYSCVSSQIIDNGWLSSGTILSNVDQVPPGPAECSVSHLTNFAVLVSARSLNFTPQETLALEILSYVTGILSILFLLVSIVAYITLWWRTRKQSTSLFKKDATILHFNFAVSLLLALIFFMASAGAYSNRRACLAMTILQYYFWLSVFTASLSIGIYLLLKIFAWNVERRFWHYLVALSWSLPIPLLIITPSLTHNYIIDDIDEICWLSNEPRYASLAFIIPMVLITAANLIFLIITAIVLYRISRGKDSIYLQLRSVLFATLLLAPLLGIPWLFSIVASLPTPATAFIFTIVLGLQGVLFAVLYPLRTPEIIKYVFLWKPVYSSESLQKFSSTNTGANASRTAPSALKFRINRKADNITSENVYSQAKPSALSEPSEAQNEFIGIQLEPVTIESSIRQMHPNLKDNDTKQASTTVLFQQQVSDPYYTKSLPDDPEDFQGSLSLKLPYHSLSIDKTDQ